MKLKIIYSSPVLYAGAGYLALCLAGFAQDAVVQGHLKPGSIESNGLAIILMGTAFLAPIIAVTLGIRHLIHKERLIESIVAIFGAIPLLLLSYGAVSRSLSGYLAA